jgi:glycosyltransferase involved in cell wall biosynthesis
VTAVLHIISGLGLGGAERQLVEVTTGLQRRGLTQQVVSLRGRGHYAAELEAAGIPVNTVRCALPDIIQGWMYHGDLAATALHLALPGRTHRRLFWNVRASNMDSARYGALLRLHRWFSRWPDTVIVNSEAGARAHGYPNTVVIRNGIDTDRFCPDPIARACLRCWLGLGDEVVALHVARVDQMKDHATFLAAMSRLPGIKGLLVGAGTTDLTCPPNVRALGVRHDVEKVYAAADIVVSSSAFGEGFSNALAEGMSCGLVPVATDVGAAALIVGDTGLLVRPRNPVALADAVEAARSLLVRPRNPVALAGAVEAARSYSGLRARRRIVKLFGRDRAIYTYARLYGAG